jgi:HTH-type transcriptional regulator / antitoxin HipB
MFGIRYMDFMLIAQQMGQQIRQKRLNRGLTQAELANIAGLTRQKVIAVEKGSLTSALNAYARVVGALDCSLEVVPAAMPTLDDLQDIFK